MIVHRPRVLVSDMKVGGAIEHLQEAVGDYIHEWVERFPICGRFSRVSLLLIHHMSVTSFLQTREIIGHCEPDSPEKEDHFIDLSRSETPGPALTSVSVSATPSTPVPCPREHSRILIDELRNVSLMNAQDHLTQIDA